MWRVKYTPSPARAAEIRCRVEWLGMVHSREDIRRTRRIRWLVLVIPSAIYFFSYFHRVASAVVAADVMRAFDISAAALGTLTAVYPYVFVAMALVAGSLAETLGPRRTLALGGFGMGVGALVFGAAPVFGVAVLGRLLVGMGASVVLISFLCLAAEWFRPDEFATVSGLTQTVGNVGGLIAASPLAVLVEAVGWRQSFVIIGSVSLLFGAASLLFVRDRPEAMGLPPVNPPRPRHALTLGEVVRGIPEIAANPRTWPPIVAASGMFATLIAVQGLWGVSYLTQVYGLTRVEAANLTSLLAVGIIVGAPLIGRLSDQWLGARRLPFVAFGALYTACWLPLAVHGWRLPLPLLAPFFFVMGFASCGLVLLWSCVREVNNPVRIGIVVGFSNMPVFLGLALLQWFTGVVLDAGWQGTSAGGVRVYPASAYEATFTVCLVVSIVALLATLLVTETRCRNIWPGRSKMARC
jgi:sugar phosphate permease